MESHVSEVYYALPLMNASFPFNWFAASRSSNADAKHIFHGVDMNKPVSLTDNERGLNENNKQCRNQSHIIKERDKIVSTETKHLPTSNIFYEVFKF